MKKSIIIVVIAAVIFSAYKIVDVLGWSRIETKLVSQGTIKSTVNEISASGWDIRTLSWIDAHGRYCTTIFTNEKGGDIDCDFKIEK